MKTFRVFRHPVLGYQAVKVGFSWPGFLFSVIWLLLKKLWWNAAIVICSVVLLTYIEMSFDNMHTSLMVFLIEIGVYVLVGVNGNEWCAARLQSEGYQLKDTLQAETPHEAIGKVGQE